MSSRLLDCRNMGSLSFDPLDGGLRGLVAAHEGKKPLDGDYLAIPGADGGLRLYRCVETDWCMNVDPANMWTAMVEFIPGRIAATLSLPLLEPPA